MLWRACSLNYYRHTDDENNPSPIVRTRREIRLLFPLSSMTLSFETRGGTYPRPLPHWRRWQSTENGRGLIQENKTTATLHLNQELYSKLPASIYQPFLADYRANVHMYRVRHKF